MRVHVTNLTKHAFDLGYPVKEELVNAGVITTNNNPGQNGYLYCTFEKVVAECNSVTINVTVTFNENSILINNA